MRERIGDESRASQNPVSVHVAGDAFRALFYVPHGTIFLKDIQGAHAHVQPVGAEYIHRAIKAILNPHSLLKQYKASYAKGMSLTLSPGRPPFSSGNNYLALYQISNVDNVPALDDPSKKLPLLRPARTETQEVLVTGFNLASPEDVKTEAPKQPDVLVHWLGELATKTRGAAPGTAYESIAPSHEQSKPPACKVHVQIGLPEPLSQKTSPHTRFRPNQLATPSYARILVVNIGEISEAHRIRRSLSYEATAVDLLRFLRGDRAQGDFTKDVLEELAMTQPAEPGSPGFLNVLAVRLNNSAVFLYACVQSGVTGSETQEECWLLCHEAECAPITPPELGQMVGYTGFVSAQLAASMVNFLRKDPSGGDLDSAKAALVSGVHRSLLWQRAAYERGCLQMLFEEVEEAKSKFWQPVPRDATMNQYSRWTEYERMFQEIVRTLHPIGNRPNVPRPALTPRSCSAFWSEEQENKKVLRVKVDIKRAVAHRTQWFMARSVAADRRLQGASEIGDTNLENDFLELATSWLSKDLHSGKVALPSDSGIPIVRIAKAELTDRREVEDYLAIHQALKIYADSTEPRPLSLAVFGAPGSGKSFAVNQVVAHIGETAKGKFRKEALTFNLGQFKSLDDLPAALHLVRNECLSGEVPIVFFDEFDSSFNGQPFGWLKYFLAPMQDGDFYHQGHNFKIGRAVFVFAGGVNRSFEELNGRVRNPGFCEAKGPDFISRLKAHLNAQGINKPEDEADQSRYLLRRGILLRGIVRQKLGLTKEQACEPLLHRCVARALLKVERFKHGVRSLEAIIKMCSSRPGHEIGPSDLPSMDQLEMHVDASRLLGWVDQVE